MMNAISERESRGQEMADTPESERFYLVLTGTLMDGFEREDVEQELSRLLRLTREQAAAMLQGKRSRIRVALNRKKVDRLQGKVVACGAGCMIEPMVPAGAVSVAHDSALEPMVQTAVMAGLELELPETLEDESCLPEAATPPGDQETVESTDEVTREMPVVQLHPEESASAMASRATEDYCAAPAAPVTKRRRRRLQQIVTALLLLGIAGWGGMQLLAPSEVPVADGSQPPKAAAKPVPVASTPESQTQRKIQRLARLMRVWMIQYGGGFDPAQVTLERVRQDLQLADADLQDAWGTVMGYQPGEGRFVLTSAGPDRQLGTGDDLQQLFVID